MIVACLKWVAHPGEPHDERFAGASPADRAALELALRQADALGQHVMAVTVGPPAADRVLRDAFAGGATRLVRVDAPVALPSEAVAISIAEVVRASSATQPEDDPLWVWCGDYSLDGGSGSVPAFVAAALGARQALGCISVTPVRHGTLGLVRRLDGGRRELLEVEAPAVVSVEGSVATLRRAGLPAVRAAATATVEVVRSPDDRGALARAAATVRPYRPRARVLAVPDGDTSLDRVRALTDAASSAPARGEVLVASPVEAANRIVAALEAWDCLDDA
ncbi:MAG: mycofactocin-associated electron transfer flavoprotein beta subunit [Ilumatobacteraceae bacterium]